MSLIWASSILLCWSQSSTDFTASLFRMEMPLLRTTSTWLSSKLLLISQASLPSTRALYQRQRMWNGWHLVARIPAPSPLGTGRRIPPWQWVRSPHPESWTALSTTRFVIDLILFYWSKYTDSLCLTNLKRVSICKSLRQSATSAQVLFAESSKPSRKPSNSQVNPPWDLVFFFFFFFQ